jgi:hypothetical protein
VRFSTDHSLAYTVVDKTVIWERKDSTGVSREETAHFAWTAIYRKDEDNIWKLECITSTNEQRE